MSNVPSAAVGVSGAVAEIEAMDVEPGDFWFGAFRNFNLIVWHRGATLDAVQRLDRTNPARVKAHPELISTVHIVTQANSGPDQAAREALNEMHARWGSTVGCAAVVIERSGLAGAAIRGAVTGMIMLAPKHYRVKVFDSIHAAAPWLIENHKRSTGVDVALPDLVAVLNTARTSGC